MRTLLCYISILIATSGFAQPSDFHPTIWIGSHFGANAGRLTYDPIMPWEDNIRYAVGPVAGIEFNWWIAEDLALGTEISIVEKGTSIEHGRNFIVTNYRIRHTYIDFPFYAKIFPIGSDAPTRLYFILGPEFGIKLTTNVTGEEMGMTRDANVSFCFGTGISYQPSQKMQFFINCMYDHGLFDISNDDRYQLFTRDIRVNAGVLFDISADPSESPLGSEEQ